MPRDDRPRKKKPAKKAADPEKLYLLIGGGVASVVVVGLVIFFAVRPSRKAADETEAKKPGADAPFAAKPPDESLVTLSLIERTGTGKGREAHGTLKVAYKFGGFPADRGRYFLVVDARNDQKEIDMGAVTEREGSYEGEVAGPLARERIKVWLIYRPDGTGPGKVVSNTLTVNAPAAPEDENTGTPAGKPK